MTLPKIETNPIITLLFEALKAAVPGEVNGHVAAPEKTTKELAPEMMTAVIAFDNAKKLAKFAKREKKKFEAQLRDALDGADVGTIAGQPVVTRVHSHNSHCDAEVLKSAFPEAYEASLKKCDYDYLKVPPGVSESS